MPDRLPRVLINAATVADTPSIASTGATGVVVVRPISPLILIGIRVARTGLQAFLGILTTMMVTDLIPANNFLDMVLKAASFAVAPAILCLVQNSIEMLQRLDSTHPEWRG